MVATKTKSALKIVDYPVTELKQMRNAKNPRWMPEQQMEALQASLTQFGIVEPLIVNTRTNQIVGGHQRLDAAIAEGKTTLPAVLIDVEPGMEVVLNLALNKNKGGWDYEKLAEMLAGVEPDQLIATGFTDVEAQSIANSFKVDDGAIAGDENKNDGIVRETRNRTETEVRQQNDATEKVQFGMFSLHVPAEAYRQWVDSLKAKSQFGESPAALGSVIAERLGIMVSEEDEAQGLAQFDGTEGEPTEEEEPE